MKVCVIGLGYIGLPTAAMLASVGHEVAGYDVNEAAVASINAGQAHFHEPDLDMLLTAAVSTGRFHAHTEPQEADVYLIAVPTPVRPDRGADMTYVEMAARSIAPTLRKGAVVVLESTSPVGSTEMIGRLLAEARPDLDFATYKDEGASCDVSLAYCPERILPGQMVRELVSNDRIIGGMTPYCAERAAEFYRTFVRGSCFLSDCRTAEFVKLSENAFRDVNIAFANELSLICDHIGVDAWEAIRLANRHPRVNILQPGPGVGGHCIAVDPWFIVESAPEQSRLIRTAREVNDSKPHFVVEKVTDIVAGRKDVTVACCGLTYKPDVDDTRESPALEIVVSLARRGYRILAVEPMLSALPRELRDMPNVRLASIDEALKADVIAFLVAHQPFKALEAKAVPLDRTVDAVGLFAGR